MFATGVVLFVLILVVEIQSKTYYFSLNKTTNEYMVRTRLNMNNSHHYPSGLYLGELRNNVTPKKVLNEIQVHPLLDPEWDYNWKNLTRPKLPGYINTYYETYSKNITSPVRFFFNAKPKNSTVMQYNTSDLDKNETISNIELHFFFKVDKNLLQKSLIVRLYQIENDFINASSLVNPDSHKLLNVIYIYQATSGWQVFKLTNTLHEWLKNRADLRLFITISKPNEEQFSIFKDVNNDTLRTFLVLKSESIFGFVPNYEYKSIRPCNKHSFPVDFNKLNWMEFIIAPSEYDAVNCYGTCYRHDEFLPNHFKVTSFFTEAVRHNLCCTPIQYSPLSIMFYDKNMNVVIKSYKDMIVSVCGCR